MDNQPKFQILSKLDIVISKIKYGSSNLAAVEYVVLYFFEYYPRTKKSKEIELTHAIQLMIRDGHD